VVWNWFGPHLKWNVMLIHAIDITQKMRHHSTIRTTLTLDDDVLELAARQAKLRGTSLSKTVSDLVRRGLIAPTPSQKKDGIVVFQLPADSPQVTTDEVLRIEAYPSPRSGWRSRLCIREWQWKWSDRRSIVL